MERILKLRIRVEGVRRMKVWEQSVDSWNLGAQGP